MMHPILATSEDLTMFIFGMGSIIAVFGIVATQWRRAREAAYNARLKQMMIERGMSAGEIERVIKADISGARKTDGCCVPEGKKV